MKYIDHFTTDKEGPCIVTDCMSSQTLDHLIDEKKILSFEEVLSYLTMILILLEHLHTKNILFNVVNSHWFLVDELSNGFKILKAYSFLWSGDIRAISEGKHNRHVERLFS